MPGQKSLASARLAGSSILPRKKGQGCGVHEGKPAICRAWPFFRGNIEDPASLALAKDFCPGIAPEVRHAEFARQGLAYLREEGLLAHDPSCEANALILK